MVEISNTTNEQVDEEWVLSVIDHVLLKEGRSNEDLSVVMLSEQEALELNRTRRGQDYVPDELSFSIPEMGLGELVLCPSKISKDAKGYGIVEQYALARSIIHGLLHLLGYGHDDEQEKEFGSKESEYLSDLLGEQDNRNQV